MGSITDYPDTSSIRLSDPDTSFVDPSKTMASFLTIESYQTLDVAKSFNENNYLRTLIRVATFLGGDVGTRINVRR